jgi:sugar phosphate permease
MLATGMLAAYYSVTTWLPTFLETERHLSVTGRTGYLLMLITGSLAGYLASAWLSDAVGRRLGFIVFAVCGAALILLYTRMPVSGGMLLIGFPLGFFVLGIFSGMGACFAELFPGAVRGSGQGFCYSIGRAIGAACPALIGLWSTHVALGQSIGLSAGSSGSIEAELSRISWRAHPRRAAHAEIAVGQSASISRRGGRRHSTACSICRPMS